MTEDRTSGVKTGASAAGRGRPLSSGTRANEERLGEPPQGASAAPDDGTDTGIGTPPPRPKEKPRRFYGTSAQIRSALTFYRVMAYVTGIFLVIMVVKILISGSLFGWTFWEGYELYIGGTTVDGESNAIGFYPADSLQDARSTSTMIAQAHGVAYIVYLVAGFRLWYMIRWGAARLALIISGGLLPFFSFFAERTIVGFVRRDLKANPEAASRY